MDAIDEILKHEGGFQNDKEDDGNYNAKGELVGTNHGITAKVLEAYRGKPVTTKDMKSLTEKEARTIYEERYAAPLERNLGITKDSPYYNHILDMSVNHGYGNTVPIVQRALGTKVDGKAGPQTRKALQNAPEGFGDALVDNRKGFYEQIMKSDPEMEQYRNGWLNRAEYFR
jgi:lysozyme family protein